MKNLINNILALVFNTLSLCCLVVVIPLLLAFYTGFMPSPGPSIQMVLGCAMITAIPSLPVAAFVNLVYFDRRLTKVLGIIYTVCFLLLLGVLAHELFRE